MKKNWVLTALFAAFAFFFALALNSEGQAQRDKTQGEKRPLMALVKDSLDLTPDQEKKLEELRRVRMRDDKAFREEMRKVRSEFREVRKDAKADEGKIETLIDEMARLKAEHMKSGLRHRREVGKVLTPEQVEKLKELRSMKRDRGFMGRGQRDGRFMNRGRRFGRQGYGPHPAPRDFPGMGPGWLRR